MAKSEINQIISGLFALLIFVLIGGALTQAAISIGGVLGLLFIISGFILAISLTVRIAELFEKLFK